MKRRINSTSQTINAWQLAFDLHQKLFSFIFPHIFITILVPSRRSINSKNPGSLDAGYFLFTPRTRLVHLRHAYSYTGSISLLHKIEKSREHKSEIFSLCSAITITALLNNFYGHTGTHLYLSKLECSQSQSRILFAAYK